MNRATIIVMGVFAVGVVALITLNLPRTSAMSQTKHVSSVLVKLTKLRTGSLPRTIAVFGTVETSDKAKQTVMAPASAIVTAIYVKPGEEVTKGAPLVRLGPSPGTAAAYTKALSALSTAHALVQRTQDLLDQHLATQQQLADARKSESDAEATLAALRAEGAASPQTLQAPFRSIVTNVSTAPGTIVNPGTALLNLARSNALVLHAGVVPERANEIRQGDPANVTSLGSAGIVSGKVTLRGSIVDSRTGLVPIEIALPTGSFLPGEMAKAEIITGKIKGYVVPHEAVLVNDDGAPYVVQATNMVARIVPVQLLLSAGRKDVVAGALDPKSPLVLAGNYQLENGMKVRVATPNAGGTK